MWYVNVLMMENKIRRIVCLPNKNVVIMVPMWEGSQAIRSEKICEGFDDVIKKGGEE